MPTVQGASFAIFLHAGNSPTLGCISTNLRTVTRLLKSAKPGDRIVMGVDHAVFAAGTKTTQSPKAADGGKIPGPQQPAPVQLQARTIAAAAGAVALLAGAFIIVRTRRRS